jgi:cytidyltransferase-like protein
MTPDPLQHWLADAEARHPLFVALDGAVSGEVEASGLAVLPGSFNPLHDGHRRLAETAAELSGREVLFELSVANVDKPSLTEAEVRRRLAQFEGGARVVLTRAPRFVEKARALPASVFVLGWDTFIRLLDVRYYEDAEAMRVALLEIRDLDCRFLVAGRVQDGTFRALDVAGLPAEFAAMFEAIPESRFRLDISSTELRAQ